MCISFGVSGWYPACNAVITFLAVFILIRSPQFSTSGEFLSSFFIISGLMFKRVFYKGFLKDFLMIDMWVSEG
jgi:hypothetical protein